MEWLLLFCLDLAVNRTCSYRPGLVGAVKRFALAIARNMPVRELAGISDMGATVIGRMGFLLMYAICCELFEIREFADPLPPATTSGRAGRAGQYRQRRRG
ncbi:hypothetical protein KM92DES2_11279 [uncultured Desulfovibrio sp.]|uniref:Uncharacterized protein n=1 Tax=uncultured Desulfovibrio sp. TaxID=167968 RepID=A0A212JK95_9BACT|nr:hypothetical protein KM92DES2_11279 [uncultured Desulfovibrio sp.]